MKKHIFFLALAALAMMASCSKETKCRCTNVNPDELGNYATTYVRADNGFSCRKITKLGVERQLEGQYVRELEEVTCTVDK